MVSVKSTPDEPLIQFGRLNWFISLVFLRYNYFQSSKYLFKFTNKKISITLFFSYYLLYIYPKLYPPMTDKSLTIYVAASKKQKLLLQKLEKLLKEKKIRVKSKNKKLTSFGRDILDRIFTDKIQVNGVVFIFDGSEFKYDKSEDECHIEKSIVTDATIILKELGNLSVFWMMPWEMEVEATGLETDLTIFRYSHERLKNNGDALDLDLKDYAKEIAFQIRKNDQISKESSSLRTSLRDNDISDLSYVFNVQVINEAGDAIITKQTKFIPKTKGIRKRKHEAFSYTDEQDTKSLKLKVWEGKLDQEGCKFLEFDFENEYKSRKEFVVYFYESLKPNQEFTYSYRYIWNDLFPKADKLNRFVIKPNAPSLEFNLVLPSMWAIKDDSFKVREEYPQETLKSGKTRTVRADRQDGSFDRLNLYRYYTMSFEDIDTELDEIKIDWDFQDFSGLG